MAAEYVTIRHPRTLAERTVPKAAAAYFPDYVVLDAVGRKSAHQPNTDKKD